MEAPQVQNHLSARSLLRRRLTQASLLPSFVGRSRSFEGSTLRLRLFNMQKLSNKGHSREIRFLRFGIPPIARGGLPVLFHAPLFPLSAGVPPHNNLHPIPLHQRARNPR